MIKIWAFLLWLGTVFCQDHRILSEYSRHSNSSLLWGPYRPNLYFGVRPRLPSSLLTGLMWYNSDSFQGIQHTRHSCEQNDNINGFGWKEYDPRFGGIQYINDVDNQVEIVTEFIKNEDQSWGVRVKGVPSDANATTTVVFYAGLEGQGDLDLVNQIKSTGLEGDVILKGNSPELGYFSINMTENKGVNRHPDSKHVFEIKRPARNTHYASLTVPDENVWMAKDLFLTLVRDSVMEATAMYESDETVPTYSPFLLQNRDDLKGRFHLMQRVFKGSFSFDILYNSGAKGIEPLTSENLESQMSNTLEIFNDKFNKAFNFHAPFDKPEYDNFAREMFSNLLGGIGYFHGKSLVDRSYAEEYEEDEENFWKAAELKLQQGIVDGHEEGPTELFTAVPSRTFFPRGFYWDEGFHLIPIMEYDADLSLEILKSWFSLVDNDGWIAREQILGPEARERVPPEFRTQYPHYANPPTLMLLFTNLIKVVANSAGGLGKKGEAQYLFNSELGSGLELGFAHFKNPELLHSYAKHIYPQLQSHYEWFRRTQKGGILEWDREAYSNKEGYRWRGRTPTHCLTSGMDDYPRASTPHTGELHVDLLSWIGMMTRSMKEIATVLEEEDDVEMYANIENDIIHNIDDLHWSEEDSMYCDSTIDDFQESIHICHKGYVTLMPFLVKLIPSSSPHIKPILESMYNPEELWSEFGIRSLSKSDEYFGTEENYWRGPVWVNINYMILDSLQYYVEQPDLPKDVRNLAREIYSDLRQNIVKTVHKNWEETGFAWEQYDSLNGGAKGVKHFNGWTSLVVSIMAMPEHI